MNRKLEKRSIFYVLFFISLTLAMCFLYFQSYLKRSNNDVKDEKQGSYLNVPSGKYSVGFKNYHIINTSSCPNKLYLKENEKAYSPENINFCNEIWLRVYYPSRDKITPSSYYPIKSIIDDLRNMNLNLEHTDIEKIKSIKSHSQYNTHIVNGKHPVIFFSPGYGLASQLYENIITEMVSHGYIVVGVNSQFISGKIMTNSNYLIDVINPTQEEQRKSLFTNSINDLKFTMEYLNKNYSNDNIFRNIDWQKISFLGHSLGAATAAYLANYKGVKAVASLDLGFDSLNKEGCNRIVNTPFLQIFASKTFIPNKDGKFPFLCNSKKLASNEYVIVLTPNRNNEDYSFHNDFSDYSTLQYHPIVAKEIDELGKNSESRVLGNGDGVEKVKIINKYLIAFFNNFISDSPGEIFADISSVQDVVLLPRG